MYARHFEVLGDELPIRTIHLKLKFLSFLYGSFFCVCSVIYTYHLRSGGVVDRASSSDALGSRFKPHFVYGYGFFVPVA